LAHLSATQVEIPASAARPFFYTLIPFLPRTSGGVPIFPRRFPLSNAVLPRSMLSFTPTESFSRGAFDRGDAEACRSYLFFATKRPGRRSRVVTFFDRHPSRVPDRELPFRLTTFPADVGFEGSLPVSRRASGRARGGRPPFRCRRRRATLFFR